MKNKKIIPALSVIFKLTQAGAPEDCRLAFEADYSSYFYTNAYHDRAYDFTYNEEYNRKYDSVYNRYY